MAKLAAQWLREIMRTLYRSRTVTRAEIIEETRLNPASVSHGLKALLQSGAILKVGELASNGGRRREVLSLNAEAAYFLTLDLEGTRIQFGLTNLVGDVRYRWGRDLEPGQTLELQTLLDGVRAVTQNLDPAQRARVLAVGVSHPGFASRDGRVTAFNLNWSNYPLRQELEKHIELPVFLEDAHRTCILAERWVGTAKGYSNCMYVIVGIGIGVGVFADGHLLEGRDGMAGELGHITIDPSAPDLCVCGRRGCLEAVASCPNIVRQYLEGAESAAGHLSGYRVSEVFERARQGDTVAVAVIDRVVRYLGLAFSYLANLFNPEIIVLGGEIVHGEDLLMPRLRAEFERHTLARACAGLELKVSSLGLDIGLKGAAALAFRNALAQPASLKKICTPMPGSRPRPKTSRLRRASRQKVSA